MSYLIGAIMTLTFGVDKTVDTWGNLIGGKARRRGYLLVRECKLKGIPIGWIMKFASQLASLLAPPKPQIAETAWTCTHQNLEN